MLPSDYTVEPDAQPTVVPPQILPIVEEVPSVSWTQAKRRYTQEIGERNPDVAGIARTYTKAAGGYRRAAKTSASAKRIARDIISLFSGTQNAIRQKFEEKGIAFEGRSSQEVFYDLYNHLRTGSALREDALADKALAQTFSDLFESDLLTDQTLDMFTPELLEFMMIHFVTYSILYKLLNEVSFGELTGNKTNEDIARIEGELKTFIDGVVRGRLPEHLHEGITPNEINTLVDELYEDCYRVMEGIAG